MHRTRSCSGWLPLTASVLCLAAGGCTIADGSRAPGPGPARPHASSVTSLPSLPPHRVGDHVTITAAVTAVLATQLFVIDDADLPERGLLVLGGPASGVHDRSLVTVRGTIHRFELKRLAEPYQLPADGGFARFEGRKVLLAESVHSWA